MNKNVFLPVFVALVAGVGVLALPVAQAQRTTKSPNKNAPIKLPSFLSHASASFDQANTAPGERKTLVVSLTIKPGFHINYWNDKNGVPTTVEVQPAPATGLKAVPIVYPPVPLAAKEAGGAAPTGYTGAVRFASTISVAKNAKPGAHRVPVTVTVQGCNETSCFPPETIELIAPLTVAPR